MLTVARNALRAVPFKGVILIMLVMEIAREHVYPLNYFPMYSSMADKTDYLYTTDGNDRPIAQMQVFGVSTAWTKKILKNRTLRLANGGQPTAAQAAQAAQEALAYVLESARDPAARSRLAAAGLKLYQVKVVRTRTGIERTTRLLASIPPPPARS